MVEPPSEDQKIEVKHGAGGEMRRDRPTTSSSAVEASQVFLTTPYPTAATVASTDEFVATPPSSNRPRPSVMVEAPAAETWAFSIGSRQG